MKKAALYIRVSTDEQAKHGFSLGEQRHDLEQYAAAHHYAVVDVYADEGNTARKAISKRKELQRLLDDVRAGHIDVILLKCLDRWFRNVRDYYKVQEVLDEYGVEWECTQEDYNTTTTNGRLMLNLKLSIAQNESDQTSDRIKYINEGKKRRKEECTGKHPFAYKSVNKKLVIIEEERPIVEFAFAQLLAGSSTHSIATKIWQEFHFAIDARRIWRIVRNPTYKGERYGIPDFCPAIIPPEEFDKVQKILSRNNQPSRTGLVYLFNGKIICPSCGSILVVNCGRSKKTGKYSRPIYLCGKKYTTGKPTIAGGCQFGGGVSERVIERWLIANIFPLLKDYEAHLRSSQPKSMDYRSKMKTINNKLARLKDLYLDELIDKDTYKADYRKLQDELAKLAIASKKQVRLPPAMDSILSDTDFEKTYSEMPREQQRELWQSVIKRIRIDRRPEDKGKRYTDFQVEFM
ncbi:Site-specific DNA recombinase [Anaerovibrio lipolyticus DSM 3074]|uniref:Resolvase n=2 Tax=Anaerovibrio lipolyticus TaxID=82374 RepID=A0A0B2JYA1_9FIRM|nr:recombinase family protein [Anaerovibrio lipolyticus]KHM51626.1 hypothetical protein NZ47_09605 [Anaerovibrio lipolyticus]SHI78435.1 Site-specific DNA recombinase [Anaerovibrio lipolyticus DSM 3074]